MNKKRILIMLCVLLSGCMGSEKRPSAPEHRSPVNETEQSGHTLSQHWIGRYSLYIQPEIISEEASNIGVDYEFEIQDSIVSFTANGHQTYFECECSLQEEGDRLMLFYKKTTEGDAPVTFRKEGDTVALITCQQGKYYVQSPVITNTGRDYNKKILLEKKPIDTSEEPDNESVPEITYWHENFEYGTETDCLDPWVIAIDEAEFLAVLAKYKNIQIDSTIQLSVTKEGYFVSLENGHTKVLSDNYEPSDAYCKYRYKGYLTQMNCYVFGYEGFEWEGITYVSKANGNEYPFWNEALFSPDPTNGYCVDAGTESEGEKTGIIKVFKTSPDKFEFMFGLWSDQIFPQTVCWQDNTTLYMKALRKENGTDQTYYYKLSLDQVQ